MIIRVERTAPADDAGLLSGPVQTLPRFRADIRADLLQLAGAHRSHVHTHLIVRHRRDRKTQTLAIFFIIAVSSLRPARLDQQTFCFLRVIGKMLDIRIVVRALLQRRICRLPLPEQYAADDRLAVDRVAQDIRQLRMPFKVRIGKIIGNRAIVRRFHPVHANLLAVCKLLCTLWCDLCHVDFPCCQLHRPRVAVRHDHKDHLLDLWLPAVIIVKAFHRNALPHIPVLQAIRSRADRILIECAGRQILARE